MNPGIARSTITTLIECTQQTDEYKRYRLGKDRDVIALSSGTGAGGKKVGEILAKRLNTRLYDEEIMEEMARETHLNRSFLELLDERVDGLKGAWFHSILTGENFCKENYCRNLINVILGLACQGGVILGRGSSFVLAHHPVFRVHIVGSSAACADRVATQENITRSLAEKRIKESDKARAEYIKKLFKKNDNDPRHFDLVVNSDHLSPEHIAALILQARNHAQFETESHPANLL
uniref:Cytidylate kinase n=1 Tax=Candidatus Kentrum sp. FW TaxID=2126338 RepID=A0A450S399_9GAMM|nr:MAG: Cytidylate kinase [Candidatus Kentron sp. FW]VFJ51443.1 MAG: Cytidylate kinase [Candidatus Kentron sp. FW]